MKHKKIVSVKHQRLSNIISHFAAVINKSSSCDKTSDDKITSLNKKCNTYKVMPQRRDRRQEAMQRCIYERLVKFERGNQKSRARFFEHAHFRRPTIPPWGWKLCQLVEDAAKKHDGNVDSSSAGGGKQIRLTHLMANFPNVKKDCPSDRTKPCNLAVKFGKVPSVIVHVEKGSRLPEERFGAREHRRNTPWGSALKWSLRSNEKREEGTSANMCRTQRHAAEKSGPRGHKRMTYGLPWRPCTAKKPRHECFRVTSAEFMQTVIRYSTLHLVKGGVDAYAEVYGQRYVSAQNRRQYSPAPRF